MKIKKAKKEGNMPNKQVNLMKTLKVSAGAKKMNRISRKKVSKKVSRDLKETSSLNFVRDSKGRFKFGKKKVSKTQNDGCKAFKGHQEKKM